MSRKSDSPSHFTTLIVAVSVFGAVAFLLSHRRQAAAPDPAASARPAATDSGAQPVRPVPARRPSPPPSAAPSVAKKPRPRRVCAIAAIGDSLTDAKSHGGRYLDYLAKRCPKSRVYNYGRGADMVNQMRRRFGRDVFGEPAPPKRSGKPRYTHLIVFGGVNDLYSDLTAGRTPEKISKDLLNMYSRAHERGVQVVALTVAPWGGFRKYYNERRGAATLRLNRWIRDQFDAGTVDYVVDAYTLLSCGQPERLCPKYAKPFKDGIHFGPAGHERLGKALYDQVFHECL
jgi:lysophospholipase L1-like esterase